jgi:hypothetical protein
MKLKSLILLLGMMATGASFGATGTFGSGVTFSTTSTEGTPIASGDHSSASAATDLGTFGIGVGNTLNLTGAGILTWKNGTGDVTGARFEYRIYTVGATPGGFANQGLGFGSNASFTEYGVTGNGGGDQFWGDSESYGGGFVAVDLLAGRSAGDYEIEWFSVATTNEGDRFENNSGNNYKATFTVVPEPTSAALGLIGSALLLRRRRL